MSMVKSLLVCLVAVCLSATALAEPPARPNILLLMAEDMSARVGAFGDEVAHTPNLDRLASEGIRYPNTFTTAGVCAPSRAAHITGMHQISFGGQHMRTTRGPLGTYATVPPAAVKAYPELLRGAGYYTWTDRKLDYQFSGPMAGSGPFTVWDDEGGGAADGWRRRERGQPFYGLVNFGVTHESGVFAPLGSWPNSITHFIMQVMRAARLPDAPGLPEVEPGQVPLPPYFPDTPTVRADVARHYGNIAIMDWEVGEILRALEADGLAGSTIVIWTTDHGDGLPRSKRELYDSGIKVPMIIRWPEAFRPEGVAPDGIDIRLVSFIDLAPTILRLAGVPQADYLQGRDLVQGEPRQYIYASRDRIDEVMDRQRAVRDERYKYIRSWYPQQPGGHRLKFRDNIDMMEELRALLDAGQLNAAQRLWFEPPGEERLFDTVADPYELDDLAQDPAYRQTLARMRGAMDDWLARVGDWSEESEADMLARFRPGGETPVTAAPLVSFRNGRAHLDSPSEHASIGYRVDEGRWRLYTGPFTIDSGSAVSVRAIRYGWEESDTVEAVAP